MMSPRRLLCWSCVFVASHIASAHDFLFGTAVALVRNDSIELTVVLPGDAFLEIFRDSASSSPFEFTKERFPGLRPAFATFAAEQLFEVRIGDSLQQALQCDVELVDDEFVFQLSYPRPPAGKLQLSAPYLNLPIAAFRAGVTVETEFEAVIASKVLVGDDPVLETALPPR